MKVPTMEDLKKRLKARKTETEDSLSQRLFKAEFEMSFEDKFDTTLVNQKLEKSLSEAEVLVKNFTTD